MTGKYVIRFVCVAGLAALLNSSCHAVLPPPEQYVNIAPLPGGGMALNSEGKPDGQGAMQVNIPVAYTPGENFFSLGAFAGQWNTGADASPSWHNGSGVIAFGFGKWPRFYGSGMAVSSILFYDSKAINLQLQVIEETTDTPAVAIGVQDAGNKEHEFSYKSSVGAGYYIASTKQFRLNNRKIYSTLGYGVGRFLHRPFAGVSTPFSDSLSLAAEYDGYQINAAIGWRPTGRFSPATLIVGWNGNCGALVGVQGTTQASGLWAIPALLLLTRH